MFKPTQPLARRLRRLALTTKQAGKDYYKGNRTGSMGEHTKWGGYKIDYAKVRTYVVPDLKGFQLTPFVVTRIQVPRGGYTGDPKGPLSGERYLQRWKAENGED
ncbi:hypothetical protein BJ546DRAFT_1007660 [Cryomyces antarcticus]